MQKQSRNAWWSVATLVSLVLLEALAFGFCPQRQKITHLPSIAVSTDTVFCYEDSIIPTAVIPRPDSSWADIDSYALAAPADVEDSAHTLARYLIAPAKDDWEKVRAIFRWIADRIRYDDAAYNSGKYGIADITTIFKLRRGVCEDYANLFNLLALQAGIQSVMVTGFSKGFSSLISKGSLEADHAWNAFLIDSTWHLLDVTWAAGYGQMYHGMLHSTKQFNPFWFDTAPEEFIFSHLPTQGKWQLLQQTLSVAEFECLPQVTSEYFKIGYSAKEILAGLYSDDLQAVPRVYTHPYNVQVVAAPRVRMLDPGDTLQLKFLCRDCQSMSAHNGGKMVEFERSDSLFCLDIMPKKGPLRIYARKRKFAQQYNGIMEWMVRIKKVEN